MSLDYTMHPQVIAFCTSCTRKRCNGEMCDDLRKKIEELNGGVKRRRRGRTVPKGTTCCEAVKYEINGIFHTLREWADIYGVNYNTVIARRRAGHSLEEALTIPLNEGNAPKMYELNGVKKSLQEWCDIYGIKYHTVNARMRAGQSLETALNKPVNAKMSRTKKAQEGK